MLEGMITMDRLNLDREVNAGGEPGRLPTIVDFR